MFGAARKAWEAEQAKLRQSHGLTAPGKNASGNVSGSDTGKARDKAGASVGVSGKSVDKAAAILSAAPPAEGFFRKMTALRPSGGRSFFLQRRSPVSIFRPKHGLPVFGILPVRVFPEKIAFRCVGLQTAGEVVKMLIHTGKAEFFGGLRVEMACKRSSVQVRYPPLP